MVKAQEEELCRQFPALFESMSQCAAAGGSVLARHMVTYAKHVFGARVGDGYSVARNVLFTEEVQCLRTPAQMSYRLLRNEANKVKAGFVEAAAPIFGRHAMSTTTLSFGGPTQRSGTRRCSSTCSGLRSQ